MQASYDFLVIGSGIAGLTFALQTADAGSVAIVTKKERAESNTNYAQGGIAAVMDEHDSLDSHIQDTLTSGAGLCDAEIVEIVVTEGPARVQELIDLGAQFSHDPSGTLHLGREGGHSANRIVHAADATGREVERALLAAVQDHPGIHVFEHHFVLELITDHHFGRHITRLSPDITCYGAYVLDEENGQVETVCAKVTMLASGGAGQVYLHTTNPAIATGDGIAMAYRAKARIANMEFVQFHPTSLYHPDASSFLISEAVRGEGGILLNQAGHRFMPDYDERLELAPRDIVARAIDDQLKQRGESCVYLDVTHLTEDHILSHFPNIHETCLKYGIDMRTNPIPVVPAAHYTCGGVMVDAFGRTTIRNLFACGEVSCTGLHGANRLASNSLLEALVFSRRAAMTSRTDLPDITIKQNVPDWDESDTTHPQEWVLVSHNREELQRVMWDYVGIVRSRLRLERAFRRAKLLYEETEDFYRRSKVSPNLCELRNMIAVANLIIRSAHMRRESRGLHYMLDYPEAREEEKRPTLV